MRVLITGAAGFVGTWVTQRLLQHPEFKRASVTLFDSEPISRSLDDARVVVRTGDLRQDCARSVLLETSPTIVFHLAGILGGAAETNYALARQVNVDATLSLFEGLRRQGAPPKVIFASSIAVFGPMPARVTVTDETPAAPRMLYGAQKHMMEVALANFSRRGELDGIALRLPGVVARKDADERMKSSFLHRLFFAYRDGKSITLPVSADGTSWLISAQVCADALIHAALLPPNASGDRRAITLPALRVSMRELVDALAINFPQSPSSVDFVPEAEVEAQFARQPPLRTAIADELGFRHDGSIGALLQRAFAGSNGSSAT